MLYIFIPMAIVACLLIGVFAENMGEKRGKADIEGRALLLVEKLQELLEEGKEKKALKLIRKFTSREASIEDIIVDFAYPLEE